MITRELFALDLAAPVFDFPTVVFSDTHMNGPGPQDNFRARLFLDVLDRRAPDDWALLFLGDIFDRYETRSDAKICKHNGEVLCRVADYDVTALEGNHDLPPKGARLELETPLLFAWHAHQLDLACSGPGGWLGHAAGAAWGLAERLRLAWAFERVRRWLLARRMRGVDTLSLRGGDNSDQRHDARRRSKVLYLAGHSHREDLCRLAPKCVYANAGSCCDSTADGKDRITYLEICGKTIRLFEVVDD